MTKRKKPDTPRQADQPPMPDAERDAARGYTDADMAEVLDTPEMTDEEIAAARPFAEVHPGLAASIRRTRGPQQAPTKELVSLRLDKAVIEKFKAGGRGWQVRMGEALKKAVGL